MHANNRTFANSDNSAKVNMGFKPSELTVLTTIENNGPLTISGINARACGINGKIELSKSTIYEALHGKAKRANSSLIARGFVKIQETKKYRTGLGMSIYTLTLRGLISALVLSEQSIIDLDPTAERWCELLPRVFGRWVLFQSGGVKKEVQTQLFVIFKQILSQIRDEKLWFNDENKVDEELIFDELIKYFLEEKDQGVVMKWNKLLYKDNGLRGQVEKHYVLSRIINETWMLRQEKKDEIMRMLREKNPDWEKIAKLEAEAVLPNRVEYTYTG